MTFFENRSVYQIMWKNLVQPDRPQMTMRHMRTACWIPKATNTHTQYVLLYCFSTATMVARTSMLRYLYVYILCLVSSYNSHFSCSPSFTLSRLSLLNSLPESLVSTISNLTAAANSQWELVGIITTENSGRASSGNVL